MTTSEKVVGVISLIAVLSSWAAFWNPKTDPEKSLESYIDAEEMLMAGADPTELFDATASGGQLPLPPLDCAKVVFGKAKNDIFVKKMADYLYVSDINGFKAFLLDESGYYANEIPFNQHARMLEEAYNRCPKPKTIYSVNVSFLMNE